MSVTDHCLLDFRAEVEVSYSKVGPIASGGRSLSLSHSTPGVPIRVPPSGSSRLQTAPGGFMRLQVLAGGSRQLQVSPGGSSAFPKAFPTLLGLELANLSQNYKLIG